MVAGTTMVATAMAQGPQWVSLDSTAQPGTRPVVAMNAALSNSQQTVLDIEIAGFYVEEVVQPGAGTFKKITLPGQSAEANTHVPGRPALPALSFLLGIPTDAPGVVMSSCTTDLVALSGFSRVLPDQPDVEEVPGANPPIPPFEFDRTFYTTSVQFPNSFGASAGDVGTMGGVRVQGANALPFQVNPATGVMECARTMQITFSHPGQPRPPVEMTIRQAAAMGGCMPNGGNGLWVTNELEYKGHYLIVSAPSTVLYAGDLVQLKKEKGYEVAIRTSDDVPGGAFTDTNVRQLIKDWYNGFSNKGDCFVLLLGDISTIPEIREPKYNVVSDHYYACIEDNDMFADVAIGRLAYDSTTDLVNQFNKIIDYSYDPPVSNTWYSSALAVGHGEVEAEFVSVLQEAIAANANDQFPLNFVEMFGTNPAHDWERCWEELSEQPHMVYYRGHGGTSNWSGWDFNGDSQFTFDLGFPWYVPTDDRRPCIMINSACANGAFHGADSWTEDWQSEEIGSVANYGATSTSRRWANHAFTRWYFELLYNGEATTLSHVCNTAQYIAAIEYAQAGSEIYDKNVWQYSLLGDPDMDVWRFNGGEVNLNFPGVLNLGLTTLPVHVTDSTGQPAVGMVVAATTADGSVRRTAFTGPDGIANLEIEPADTGSLVIQAYDLGMQYRPKRSEATIKCPSDMDADSDVDSDDIIIFFRSWEAGEADFDDDLDSDSDDIIVFFGRWDSGC